MRYSISINTTKETTMTQDQKNQIAALKKRIIRIAERDVVTMRKPRIRAFKMINLTEYTYEKAVFELVDEYTCFFTKQKKKDIYQCTYDGLKLTVIAA